MSGIWFLARSNKRLGPFSTDQLKKLVIANELRPTDMILAEGTRQWVAAGTVPDLFVPTPPPLVTPPAPPVPDRLTVLIEALVYYGDRQKSVVMTLPTNVTLADCLPGKLLLEGITGTGWVVRYEGRQLELDRSLAQQIPDLEPGDNLSFEIWAVPPRNLPMPGGAAPSVGSPRQSVPQPPMDVPTALRPPLSDDAHHETTSQVASDPESVRKKVEAYLEEAGRGPVNRSMRSAEPPREPAESSPNMAPRKDQKAEDDHELALEDSEVVVEDEDASEVLGLDEGADLEELEEEEEAEVAPRRGKRRAARPPITERRATVRYYNRMNPQRVYPLLVVIAKTGFEPILQEDVAQRESKPFRAAEGSLVEVEPILPGCQCYPAKEHVRITSGEVRANFSIVPQVLGDVTGARIVLRQDGRVLSEVPLEMRVVTKLMVAVMGVATVVLPLLTSLLKHLRLDFDSQLKDDFHIYATIAQFAFNALTPEVLTALLLTATVMAYFWLRPRERDLFWDLVPVHKKPPPPRLTFGERIQGACRRAYRVGRQTAAIGGLMGGMVALAFLAVIAAASSLEQAWSLVPILLGGLAGLGILGGAIFGCIEGAVGRE
jgi:hypothetical protein